MFVFLLGWMALCPQNQPLQSLPSAEGTDQTFLEDRLAAADAVVFAWAESALGHSRVFLHVRRQWKTAVPKRISVKRSENKFSSRRQLGLAFLAKEDGAWNLMPGKASWIPLDESQAYVYSQAMVDWQAWQNRPHLKIQRESRLHWWVQLAASPVTLGEVAPFFRRHPVVILELEKSQRAILLKACSQDMADSPPELLDLLLALDSIPAFESHGGVQRTLALLHHATQTPQPYLAEDHWLYTRQPEISSWANSQPIGETPKPIPPGYGGTFCSSAGAKVLQALREKNLAPPTQDWRLVSLHLSGSTPHFFSGKRGGKGKGPHAVLSNGTEKYVFPVETDADAAVLATTITSNTPPQLKGIISPALHRAMTTDPLPGF